MGRELHHFIDGGPATPADGRFGDVFNPATGEVQARCPYASAAEVDSVVEIASAAAPAWATTSIAKRLDIIFRFRNEFQAARDELAELIGLEHGKTLADAQGELHRAVEAIDFACSMPHLTKGEYSWNIGGDIDNFSIHQPLGVVAGICRVRRLDPCRRARLPPGLRERQARHGLRRQQEPHAGASRCRPRSRRRPLHRRRVRLGRARVHGRAIAVPIGESTADGLVEKLVPRVERYVGESLGDGAQLRVDGRGISVEGYEHGFFTGGTLLDNVATDTSFYKEEVFGPARGIVRAGDVDEAIDLVNGHEFGNGAEIFTCDGHAARRFFNEIDVGMIGVNVPVPVPAGYHNFGGLKRSKFGEGHLFGPDAARFYTKIKTVSARRHALPAGAPDMTMPTNE